MDSPIVLLDGRESTTLNQWIRTAGRVFVIDFWNARCTHCPSALTKLDHMAIRHPEAAWGACALALTVDNTPDESEELISDEYANLDHAYMSYDAKEELKRNLNFTTLPFCVVCAPTGDIIWKGDPRDDEFDKVLAKVLEV